jgi:hypothetical protein
MTENRATPRQRALAARARRERNTEVVIRRRVVRPDHGATGEVLTRRGPLGDVPATYTRTTEVES